MLYKEFNSHKNFVGEDVFIEKAHSYEDIYRNLNPTFKIRHYQFEALGRLFYYFEDYKKKQLPVHLLFNMATGSGKTLIMAASILYFYKQGYRNFIFFTRLGNIIEKTKANFLKPQFKKYLFSDKIILDGQEIFLKSVDNFNGTNDLDINIFFSTTSLLHSRFNFNRENSLTYEDIKDQKIVLLADEAHNLSAETNRPHSKADEEDRRNWENTVENILSSNYYKENILLEFTATARLEQEYPEIISKYKNKAIFRYDLKDYRLDGFSKNVRALQINAPNIDRALTAVIISQYRRKIAEKYNISLKPVVLFKSNRVSIPSRQSMLEGDNPTVVVSSLFKEKFHELISNLNETKIYQQMRIKNETLQKAFKFFEEQKISPNDLINEIKNDFSPEKCLSVDEDKDLEQKQLLINSLEDQNNEIRAIFATEKLNEGWDVLNLFDIVRLYNSRDARANVPGHSTTQEAQLIGRGARYYPFIVGEFKDLYRRKFDYEENNELRILEQLDYHCVNNSRYIQELETVLVRDGILAPHTIQKVISVKDVFKESTFWKNGLIFLNSRIENLGINIFSLSDAKAEFDHNKDLNLFTLHTGESSEKDIFTGIEGEKFQVPTQVHEYRLIDFGINIIRATLDRHNEGAFSNLKQIFGNLKSINDFIINENYLGGVHVKVRGTQEQLLNLSQKDKLSISEFVIKKIVEEAHKRNSKYLGSNEFKASLIKNVFGKEKVLRLDGDSYRAQNMRDFDFGSKDWFSQNEIWGTSEEESFLRFMDGVIIDLKKKYEEIALLRNEMFFKLYNFSDGEPFYPDFVLFLKEKETHREVFYQVFIEPKGDQFLDMNHTFEQSKEGWKQQFLIDIEKDHLLNLKYENKDFVLLGLPFFNEGSQNIQLRDEFESAFNEKILNKTRDSDSL